MRGFAGWLSVSLLALTARTASAQFALRNGDRVVFYGDSITDNAPYTMFIENFVLTRFPKMGVRFFNAGVGGDRVTGGVLGSIDERLSRDVISRRPTVVTVMLGMNDGNYQAFNQATFDKYKQGLAHIADRFHREIPNARIWFIKPSPFDDVTRPYTGYNDVLRRFGGAVEEIANARGYGLIDLNAPVLDALTRANATDANVAQTILADRVHPWLAGNLVMAAAILRAWGAPNVVSRTDVDAANGRVVADGVTVKNVRTDGAIRWISVEDSLPFPFDHKEPATNLVLRTSPVEDSLGREVIRVHKLPPGNYRLSVDGQPVGEFSADTFNSGVDMSWMDTAMTRQAAKLAQLTQKRMALSYFAWRSLEVGLSDLPMRDRSEAIHGLERTEEELVRRQHEVAIPKPHDFEVSKVTGSSN